MDIKDLQKNWNEGGKRNAFLAVQWLPEKIRNKWHADEFFETGRREAESVMAWLRSLGLTIPKGRALDFGCGPGRLTQALAAHFDEVAGVDIAPSMLKLAAKHNKVGSRCRYYLNDNPDLRLFGDSSFQFILSVIVLQHMKPDYAKSYIREFLRVVSGKGIVVFQMPTERIANPPRIDASIWADPDDNGFLARVKSTIKTVVPGFALRSYHKWRYGDPTNEPIFEMYGIPRDEIEQLIAQSGGKVLAAVPHPGGGVEWRGFQYCVVKS